MSFWENRDCCLEGVLLDGVTTYIISELEIKITLNGAYLGVTNETGLKNKDFCGRYTIILFHSDNNLFVVINHYLIIAPITL